MTRKISRASIVVAAAYALFLSLPFWAFTDPPPQPPRKALTAEETAKQDAFTAELNTLIVEQRAEQDALDAKYEAKFDKLFGLPALSGEAPVK